MSYPEEAVTYCPRCELAIPSTYYWRGRGLIITNGGRRKRTLVLYSVCPECGRRYSTGLNGPPVYRWVYGWLWKLRYPATRPPTLEEAYYEAAPRQASGQ